MTSLLYLELLLYVLSDLSKEIVINRRKKRSCKCIELIISLLSAMLHVQRGAGVMDQSQI